MPDPIHILCVNDEPALNVNPIWVGKNLTRITVPVTDDGSYRTLSCSDDGIEIPMDENGNVFLHGSGYQPGIGLFLAGWLFAITGISIRERNAFKKGSRFEVILPLSRYQGINR